MTKNAENGLTREGRSTNLVSITPNFIVKDLQASIAFYVERLGFQVSHGWFPSDMFQLMIVWWRFLVVSRGLN